MLDLELDNLEKYLEFVDNQLLEDINGQKETKTDNIVHDSWIVVRNLVCNKGYADKISLENMKEDIIMSVYAAVVYKIIEPVERSTIVRKAAKILGGSNFENTVRKTIDNAEDFFVKNLDFWNCWSDYCNLYEWDYFKPIIRNQNENIGNKIKVFDEYDFYAFLDARDSWLFNQENSVNGMTIANWYKGINKIFEKLSKKPIKREKTADDILNFFIIEQMFSVISITTMIQSWLKITKCDFYSLDNGLREKELFLISVMAGLPKSIIDKYIGRLVVKHEMVLEEMWSKPLYNQVLQINYLKLYVYPLCKILLYYTINMKCKRISKNCSISKIQEFIKEYIEERRNLERFTFTYNLEKYYKEFAELRFPFEYDERANSKGGNQSIIIQGRNNAPVESFGINFTYFYLTSNERRDLFKLQYIKKHELNPPLTRNEQSNVNIIGNGRIDYRGYIINETSRILNELGTFKNYKTDNYTRFDNHKA